MARKFSLSKNSEDSLEKFKNLYLDILSDEKFFTTFYDIVKNDVKTIKDCSEKHIVEYYIKTAKDLLTNNSYVVEDSFFDDLKDITRHKLVNKYVSNESFDNNIDIYFNEVKREYILHPMGESEDMIFVPENKDLFIKNNLKLVISIAKKYRNLGLPFEDLIQAGNEGLLVAFDKFDVNRANLKISIINAIKEAEYDYFTYENAIDIIKKNFKYSKLLNSTLEKIPLEGFKSKQDFLNWADKNIKKASFTSIGKLWVTANILAQLNKLSKIIKVPSSSNNKNKSLTIISLDSINPHTDDNYYDNQLSSVTNEEFIIEDEQMQNMEKQNLFRKVIDKVLCNISGLDRRIIKKRFGLDLPFQMSISEIAENEGVNQSVVKSSINSTLKIISTKMSESDRQLIKELLR